VPFGLQQFLIGCCGALIGEEFGVQQVLGRVLPGRGPCFPVAFAPGGGCQPAGKRAWVPEGVQVSHQVEPDVLADVLGVGFGEPVPAAD
jgi:hypothetical protein